MNLSGRRSPGPGNGKLVLDQDVALDYAKTAKAAFPVVDDELFQFDKKLAHADLPADVVKAVKAKGK